MQIKMIYVPRFFNKAHFMEHILIPPLGMPTITSYLRNRGLNVDQDDLDVKVYRENLLRRDEGSKILDITLFDDQERIIQFIENDGDEELERIALRILDLTDLSGIDVFGLSIVDDHIFSVLGMTIVIAKLLKEITGTVICVGGISQGRPAPELSLAELNFIDFIIYENHVAFYNLCNALEKGYTDLEGMPGVIVGEEWKKKYFQSDGKARKKAAWETICEDIDIHFRRTVEDARPMPDFDGLPLDHYRFSRVDAPFYKLDSDPEILVLPYSFVVGCPNHCIFCSNSLLPTLKHKTAVQAASELKFLSKKYNTRYFLFLNSNINVTHDFAEAFCHEVISNGLDIAWSDCANFKNMRPELIKNLKQAGAVRLIYGLESASPTMMKYIEKRVSLEMAESMLDLSHKEGIWNELEIIAGMPHETESDVEKTVQFINKWRSHIDGFHLNRFMLLQSRLLSYPERYRIENISDLPESIGDLGIYNRAFDEVGGLKWKAKMDQIEWSYLTIEAEIKSVCREPIPLQLIFYSCERFGDKNEARDYLEQVTMKG